MIYDRVIWPEKYDPKTSAIYALNDIEIQSPIWDTESNGSPHYYLHSHSIVPGGLLVTS